MSRKRDRRIRRQQSDQRSFWAMLAGRCFVNPVFDYLLIGGVLSLVVTIIVVVNQTRFDFSTLSVLPYFILLSNSAHFAASTVRLYTKPGSFDALPRLTLAFPLVAMGMLTLCMFQAETLGPHLQSLYLTWSPYHYAAQAYGLAVMYCYRSGCNLSRLDKRLLWWVSMIAFFYAFVKGNDSGLEWLASSVAPLASAAGWETSADLLALPSVASFTQWLGTCLWVMAYAAPFCLFVKTILGKSGPMPLISLFVVFTNGIWWILLPTKDAFVWATIFHGIQYLAIVIIFHVKDQLALPDNRHGAVYHVTCFYGASLLLGYALFQCLPWAYMSAGFGEVESILMVVATINIHHFIVDGYIWRLKKTDSNRRIVDSGQAVAARATS